MVEAQVGIGIMAHPAREKAVDVLMERVAPHVICFDRHEDEWRNGAKTWRNLSYLETEWSIVLQDDALPVDGFLQHAQKALAHAPQTAVSFYVGTGRPRRERVEHAVKMATLDEHAWLEADTLLWGVAVAMPTAEIEPMLEWAERSELLYDQRIGQWFHRQGKLVRYTWPSLVDHADTPSLVRNRPREYARVAHRTGVPETWDTPITRILDQGARIR